MSRRSKFLERQSKKQDRIRIDSIRVPEGPRQCSDKHLILRVTNEFVTAKAEWRRIANVWSCPHADPAIKWMVGMNRDGAMIEVLRRGMKQEWLPFLPADRRPVLDPVEPMTLATMT